MTSKSSQDSAAPPTPEDSESQKKESTETKKKEAQLIIQASHPPNHAPRPPLQLKKQRQGAVPKSAPVSSFRVGALVPGYSHPGHSSEKAVSGYRPTLLKQNKYFNDTVVYEDKGKRDPDRERSPPDFAHRFNLKLPKRSLEGALKPQLATNPPKTSLFMYNFAGQRLFRKKSQEVLEEAPESNKTLLSLRDKQSEGEGPNFATVMDPKNPNLYAKGYRNPARKPKGYSYQLPPALFHSLLSNKRYNLAADLRREERTDRHLNFAKKPSGQIEAFEERSGEGTRAGGGASLSSSRAKNREQG